MLRVILVGAICCASITNEEPAGSNEELNRLPEPLMRQFKSDAYIRAASQLRKMGRKRAGITLLDLAKDKTQTNKVIALCRMLFIEKPGTSFRRPRMGCADYMGDTSHTDWPREPIELVDGVPFIIVAGYRVAGFPETASSYLEYCLKECDWGTGLPETVSPRTKQSALNKLLTSDKWKSPLTKHEKLFLSLQVN